MSDIPIIIDNGSYECRVGFANSEKPNLVFKNILARNRANRKDRDWDLQVGNEIKDIEALRWMIKTPFDLDVVVNFSVQETLLDYAFDNLHLTSVDGVNHPVLITEAIANPGCSRKNMSELLLEAYSVPKVSYGIDCLFSLHQNKLDKESEALIISSGFQTTHVLPVIDHLPQISQCQRINLGGYNCSAYLQRLLQLRHPHIKSFFTLSMTENMLQSKAKVALDYNMEANKYLQTGNTSLNEDLMNFDLKMCSKENLKNIPVTDEALEKLKHVKKLKCKLNDIEHVIEYADSENMDKLLNDAGHKSLDELAVLAGTIKQEIIEANSKIEMLNLKATTEIGSKTAINTKLVQQQAAEIIFHPSLVGFSQSGLSMCIDNILKKYPSSIQEKLTKNIFVTGGNTKIQHFVDRLFYDIPSFQPHSQEINIKHASNPSTDGWKGASNYSMLPEFSSNWITREEFSECGWDYLKIHRFSNLCTK